MISRCSKTRDRIMNRSEWSSEKTTDATERGHRRTYVTSIDTTCTVFSIATAAVVRSCMTRPPTVFHCAKVTSCNGQSRNWERRTSAARRRVGPTRFCAPLLTTQRQLLA
jgi:hypothetical protein